MSVLKGTEELCPECWGESDPIDDAFYCYRCAGRGWVPIDRAESPTPNTTEKEEK